jgi:hypothetical protein
LKQSSQKILLILDDIMSQESVKAVIDSLVPRVEQKLKKGTVALLAWEPVPLDTYGEDLPSVIQSSWIFIVRAQAESGAERHPNSHQYMMSYKGSGDLKVKTGEEWNSNLLVSNPGKAIESRWVSIPPYTWHQAIATKENWVVVSFHTVPEEELIEERPDPTDTQLTRQRLYSDE